MKFLAAEMLAARIEARCGAEPRVVTSFQHCVIVSEHGRAEIFGWRQQTQAGLLVDRVADPRARDELRESIGRFCRLDGAPVE